MRIDSLFIGELKSFELKNIKDHVTNLNIDLTTNMVSELSFTVNDDDFNMFNSNYFIAGRHVTFNGENYEIASVTLNYSDKNRLIDVKARSRATERMRWDKGNQSFGNISPSIFAANMAAKYGLKIFAEDSPSNGDIKQESNDNNFESIWDVLIRLAKDLDFLCFEARGILFFASQKFIIRHAPLLDINSLPSNNDKDVFYAVSLSFNVSEDAKKPYSGNVSLLPNTASESIYPGCSMRFTALKQYADIEFMVDRVNITAGADKLVSVSFSSPVTLEERMCELTDYARGSSGECVKRIQKAVLTTVDGVFGPVTEKAVKAYQTFYGKVPTGIVSPSDGTVFDGVTIPSTWSLITDPPFAYVKQIFSSSGVGGGGGGGGDDPGDTPPVTRKIIGYDELGMPIYEPWGTRTNTVLPRTAISAGDRIEDYVVSADRVRAWTYLQRLAADLGISTTGLTMANFDSLQRDVDSRIRSLRMADYNERVAALSDVPRWSDTNVQELPLFYARVEEELEASKDPIVLSDGQTLACVFARRNESALYVADREEYEERVQKCINSGAQLVYVEDRRWRNNLG